MTKVDIVPCCAVKDAFRDSTKWSQIKPRKDDIIIATCYKSGTTLTQQIVNLLLNGDKNFTMMRDLSPWVESSLYAPQPSGIEALASPRFLKTHLHPQALPWLDTWRYIYLARDGRDVGLSLYNHCRAMEEECKSTRRSGTIDNGPADFSDFWDQWVETGSPRWDFWSNVDSWWQVRHQSNVLLVHYNDLVHNKPIEVERIADFLGCEWDSAICEQVCEYSSIDYMRQLELEGKFGSPDKNKKKTGLVNQGTNGRWKSLLTNQQLDHYAETMRQRLEPDCAAWLQYGGHIN